MVARWGGGQAGAQQVSHLIPLQEYHICARITGVCPSFPALSLAKLHTRPGADFHAYEDSPKALLKYQFDAIPTKPSYSTGPKLRAKRLSTE